MKFSRSWIAAAALAAAASAQDDAESQSTAANSYDYVSGSSQKDTA